MKVITRAGWGARAPKGSYTPLAKTRGTKVHYTGGYINPKIVDDHDICLDLMRAFQRQHMDVNRWTDFAYNLAACPHNRLLEGRGFGVMSAANGEGQNTGHYALLALVGSSGFTQPTDDLLHAARDGIDLLRKHGAGNEIKGHRDGYSTTCPGGPMYAWVKKGAPRPGNAPAKPKPAEKPLEVVWDGDVPRWPGRVLKHVEGADMLHGEDVEVWQTKMECRGWNIDVDGWYGEQSADVARGYRRGTGLPVGDTVDRDTWDMTWSWKPPAADAKN